MLPAIIARIRDTPAVREQENKYGPGIMPRWDADGNVTQIVFTDSYTREMADSWLANHGYSGYSLDEQTRENEDEAKPFTRALSFDFQQIGGRFEDLPSGGLIVRGVKLLAAGIWTDSAQGTPLEYSSDVLQRYAGNWVDSAMWSRHSGGVPRNITEKVGEVLNQRYENEAVVGDLHYHGLTQQSRDTIAMVKAGQANFVSVEHGGKEKWNPGRRIYQAEELTFTGLATVNRGACAKCTIRDNEAPEGNEDTMREHEEVKESDSLEGTERKIRQALGEKLQMKYSDGSTREPWVRFTLPDQVVYEGEDGEYFRIPYTADGDAITFGEPVPVEMVYKDKNSELEMTPEELAKFKDEFKKELSAETDGKIKELADKNAALEERNKELSARLEALEKAPAPAATNQPKELEALPEYYVSVNRKSGIVGA